MRLFGCIDAGDNDKIYGDGLCGALLYVNPRPFIYGDCVTFLEGRGIVNGQGRFGCLNKVENEIKKVK